MRASSSGRAWGVARLLALTSGRAALDSSLGFYCGLLMVASILFGGNGMDAHSVTHEAVASRPFRVVAIVAWALCVTPAARALLQCPCAAWLRPLPAARGEVVAWLSVGLALVNLPWAALWLRGAGVAAGAGALLSAMGLGATLARREGDLGDLALGGVTLVAWAACPPGWAAPVAAPLAWAGVARAWSRVAEPRALGRHVVPRRGRTLAIAVVLAVTTCRHSGASCARATGFILVAAALGALALRNNGVAGPDAAQQALAIRVPACWLAAATLAGPLLGAESRAAWLLQLSGPTNQARAVAAAGVLAVAGVVGGLAFTAALGWQRAPASLQLATVAAAGGAATAILAAGVVRWSRRDGREGRATLVTLLGLASASTWLTARDPLTAVVASWAAALAVTAWSSRQEHAEVPWPPR